MRLAGGPIALEAMATAALHDVLPILPLVEVFLFVDYEEEGATNERDTDAIVADVLPRVCVDELPQTNAREKATHHNCAEAVREAPRPPDQRS